MPLIATLKGAKNRALPHWQPTPVQILALGFLLIIVLGAGLLYLPISQQPGARVSLLDCLFIATSATCVTGLVTVSTADAWTVFGQTVILLMIQLGGLGYMTFATLLALLLGARIGLRRRLQLREAHGAFTLQDAVRLVRFVGLGSLLLESLGAAVLALRFHLHHQMAWDTAFFEGIFYSISAFCNAGFDLVPGFQGLSFPAYQRDLWLLASLSVLIVLGGLGFAVLEDLSSFPKTRRFSLHTKLVLTVSAGLIVIGMGCFLLFEVEHPLTLGPIDSTVQQGMLSWFMSVSPRTAGFSPIDISTLSPPTVLLIEFLMVIGASPYSTGGGVKTTTVAVLVLAVVALMRRCPDTEAFGRRIGGDMIRLAVSVVIVYMLAVLFVIFAISIMEITLPTLPTDHGTTTLFTRLTFEVVSAFSTVGLSMGLTPTLTSISKAFLMLAMYFGRLGPLAFIFIFTRPGRQATLRRLPSERVIAG